MGFEGLLRTYIMYVCTVCIAYYTVWTETFAVLNFRAFRGSVAIREKYNPRKSALSYFLWSQNGWRYTDCTIPSSTFAPLTIFLHREHTAATLYDSFVSSCHSRQFSFVLLPLYQPATSTRTLHEIHRLRMVNRRIRYPFTGGCFTWFYRTGSMR